MLLYVQKINKIVNIQQPMTDTHYVQMNIKKHSFIYQRKIIDNDYIVDVVAFAQTLYKNMWNRLPFFKHTCSLLILKSIKYTAVCLTNCYF